MIQQSISEKLLQKFLFNSAGTNNAKFQLASEYKTTDKIAWKQFQTLMYGAFKTSSNPKDKVLAFDMDGTLIVNKNGLRFASKAENSAIYNSLVKKKLTSYYNEGYNLVLFTNQKGISTKVTNPLDVMNKIQKMCDEINLPMQVIVSTANDQFRKPQLGMWKFYIEKFNQRMQVNLKNSLFCGDSAGRKFFSKFKSNDINDFDLKFAQKIGINFQTPEEFFFEKQIFRLC